ncbi:MAG: DUF2279 domain-containing protein [Bacteroidota bacterium]
MRAGVFILFVAMLAVLPASAQHARVGVAPAFLEDAALSDGARSPDAVPWLPPSLAFPSQSPDRDASPRSVVLLEPSVAREDSAGTANLAPTRVRPWRVGLIVGASAVGAFAAMDSQRRRWWEERTRWKIQNDWDYVRWADKLGHFAVNDFWTRLYRSSMRWSGLSERDAALWGAGLAFANSTYYEILDGFGPRWGFSPGDLAFNVAGIAFASAKPYVPALQPFSVKLSYVNSGWADKNFIDDYQGQTYWLVANLDRLAPGVGFPEWLGVTVGYGARGLNEINFLTESHVYVGLDIGPEIIPFEGRFWDVLRNGLSIARLPAPAVRITPDARVFVLAWSPQ